MITCGFFNSINGDRTYNAEQMNNPYKRIVSNGVFADKNKSDDFKVQATGEMRVLINKGDGIFDGKWATNDSPYELVVPVADVYNPRIDAIIFRVNYVERLGEVILVQGVPSENPIAPDIIRNDKYIDYRLANIYVDKNVFGINEIDITDTRASSECGFVTHLLEQSDVTTLYSQWQAQFENWFLNIKETIATTTVISSFSSRFIATENDTISVPINITNYNSVLDILQVYKNGLLLVEGFDYTIDNFNYITLANPIKKDTQISFVVYKSVDGSEAETVVRDIEELYKRIKVAENTIEKLNSKTDEALWTGADVMGAGATITPNKKLSECKNGWVLVWSDYDDTSGVANNSQVATVVVPKQIAPASSFYCIIPSAIGQTGIVTSCGKSLGITDDSITGYAGNNATTDGQDVCLKAVYEY